MSQNNILQSCSWENQHDDDQVQFVRPIPDEMISVYEVYVKEETVGSDGRSEISVVSGVPDTNDHQLIEVLEQRTNANEDSIVVYSRPIVERPLTTTRLIDKDDPRSKLHFVKYLKRDGKTLKVWECGICAKEFRHQYTLMRHLPTHTDERNFKCEVCGKAFRQLSTLSQHKAIHSDARPYVCEFCKKTFNRVSTLISHRKTHSEHKPHKCHLCGKGFHQKGNLRNHVFTHTNERPYKCELCGKGFNQMSNLVCHKVKAHAHVEKMQYICAICGKEFPRRFSLRSHEEFKHGIKYRHFTGPQNADESNVVRNKDLKIVHLPNRNQTPLTDVKEKEILSTMLTPATTEDLRVSGKLNSNLTLKQDVSGIKSIQIKVPVVATIVQRVNFDGKLNFSVEPPRSEQKQENIIEQTESQCMYSEQFRFNLEGQNKTVRAAASDDCNELLELAALGGIQFVRATEDGRYEVMTNNEARDLMAQNSHDVTILDEENIDAINVVNTRGNSLNEVITRDADSQAMVLTSGLSHEGVFMDDIESLKDKDIKILETKSQDDNSIDRITFLSQSKFDDLILGSNSLNIDASVGTAEQNDVGQPTISTSNESLSYLKASQILNDELNISRVGRSSSENIVLDVSMEDYDSKLKLVEFNNDESDSEMVPPVQPEITILGPGNRNERKSGISETVQKKAFTAFEKVKILGPKGQTPDVMSHFQEIKVLGNYEQFIKSTPNSIYVCTNSVNQVDFNERNEVKILGRRLETEIPSTTQNDSLIQMHEEKTIKLMTQSARNPCDASEAIVIQDFPNKEKYLADTSSEDFIFQACNSPNFLNIENHLPDRDAERPF